MKKLSIFVTIMVLMMALAACGTGNATTGPSPTMPGSPDATPTPGSPDATSATPGPTPKGPTDQGNGPGLRPVALPYRLLRRK